LALKPGSPAVDTQASVKRRLALTFALIVCLAVVAAPGVQADQGAVARATAAVSLTVTGHGFGHGVGLSQWGAEARAEAGQSYREILSFYYPGTTIGSAPDRPVRILLAERRRVRLGSTAAFSIVDAAGVRTLVRPGSYAVGPDGRFGPLGIALPAMVTAGAAPLRLGGKPYVGTFRLISRGGRLRVVDTLQLERYLVGVVSSENPGYWPQDALRAQAVASRTYALANLRPKADFDLYPDDRSQNYKGLVKDFSGARAAVAATNHEILLFAGRPIDAFFSASNGGMTSRVEPSWGGPALPYFAAREDPFDRANPVADWGPITVSVEKLRRAFPDLPAAIASVDVTQDGADRAVELTFFGLDGSASAIQASDFQTRLGLRSTFLSVALD
jgi:stage II sporulation protein D